MSSKLNKAIQKVLNEDQGLSEVYSILDELRFLKTKQQELSDQFHTLIDRLLQDLGGHIKMMELQDERVPQIETYTSENGLTASHGGDDITVHPDFGTKQWNVSNSRFRKQFGDQSLNADVSDLAGKIVNYYKTRYAVDMEDINR